MGKKQNNSKPEPKNPKLRSTEHKIQQFNWTQIQSFKHNPTVSWEKLLQPKTSKQFSKVCLLNLQYLFRGQHLAKEINDYYNKHSKNHTREL